MNEPTSVKRMNSPVAVELTSQADESLHRKISRRIIPFLFVCYVVAILDRNNIGFAQLQMKQDLSLTDAMYSLGAVFFFFGYVLFEVPSNLLMHRVGARKTFARIMFLWGAVSVLMVFVSSSTQFYILRFVLGLFEAGFFPGIVLYLTFWIPAQRRARALSVFYAGVAVAGVLGGLVSGWIMRDMAGIHGFHGWQWMFAIEGAPAVVFGLVAWFFLKDRPQDANWLTAAEKTRVTELLEREHRSEAVAQAHSFKAALVNANVYLLAFVYFCLTSAILLLLFWMPVMIKGFGVNEVVQISLYSAIPNALGVVGVIVIARHSDKRNERKWHFVSCALVAAAALSLLANQSSSFVISMCLLSVATVAIYAAHPVFWSVPATLFHGAGAAGSIALVSSIGVSSGMVTPWIIGQIKTYTGSMNNAFYFIAFLLLLSSAAMVQTLRRKTDRASRVNVATL